MTVPADLGGRLSGATPAELATFAAACATRMTPVFDYFALAGTGRYRDWLAQVWASTRSPDVTRARELRQQIMSVPETDGGADSNRPDYYAARALGVLFYAVRLVLDENKAASASACAKEARTILGGWDYLLEIAPDSPGSLRSAESRAQYDWLDRHADSLDMNADLAAEAGASAVVERLREAAPAVARVRGWDMAQWRPA